LLQAINSEFYSKAKEAVIEKWLRYAKYNYLDEMM